MSIYIKIQICKQLYVILYAIPCIIVMIFNEGQKGKRTTHTYIFVHAS